MGNSILEKKSILRVFKNRKEEIKERDYFFDNLKVALIFLVVLGHFLELGLYKNNTFKAIWYAIYSFHMPLFIFITGYFTKYNTDNTRKAIKNYLIPYIILNVLIKIFKDKGELSLLLPEYGMWFLLTIFWYKIMYNEIYKIRGLLLISIVLAIVIGLDRTFNNIGSFSRTVVFFPFFIAGNKFKKEYLIKNKKWIKIIFMVLIPTLLIFFSYLCIKTNIPMDLLRGSIPYENLNIELKNTVIARTLILAFAFLISYMILNIIPNQKLDISYIGQNTVITYLGHIFLILVFRKFNILSGTSYKTFIISIIASIVVVFITSIPILKRAYNYVIERIAKIINI